MSSWGKFAAVTLGALFAIGINGQKASAKKTPQKVDPITETYSNMTSAKMLTPTQLKPNNTTTFDIILKPRNEGQMYSDALAVNTPGNSQFKHYITQDGIRDKYGQPTSVTNDWKTYLKKHHLTANAFKSGLVMTVKGKIKDIDKTFKVNINKATYHSNPLQFGKHAPKIPGRLSDTVYTVIGMTDHNKKYFYPDSNMQFDVKNPAANLSADNKGDSGYYEAGGTSRFVNRYNLDKLYQQGATGKGQTVGLITFGGVRRSDVLHFWKHENASTASSRFTVKNVQGDIFNKDFLSPADDEATMDVEYAGSVAPQADVRMYESKNPLPNLQNITNAFSTAYQEAKVSSLSLSWGTGSDEYYNLLINRGVMDPHYVNLFNLLFAQGALQGISTFAASGDTGAPMYSMRGISGNRVLLDRKTDVADPINTNPFITSVGGTTLPFTHKLGSGATISASKERAWGSDYYWDVLQNNPEMLNSTPGLLMILGAGGGGGFSHLYSTPTYQQGVKGVNTFAARTYLSNLNQPIFGQPLITGTDYGRNYPDVAANADPTTGYNVYMKSKHGNGWQENGGTSIVGPQIAGATAVINSLSGRQPMGFWNPQIYQLAQTSDSPFTPMNSTTDNSNMYYTGQPNTIYNQATGLGTINFDKLAKAYK